MIGAVPRGKQIRDNLDLFFVVRLSSGGFTGVYEDFDPTGTCTMRCADHCISFSSRILHYSK
jgi:hypothetical protein